MPAYTLRAVLREPSGVLGPTLYEEVIEAANPPAAIQLARNIDIDFAQLGASAVYLADPNGMPIWSLHVERDDD